MYYNKNASLSNFAHFYLKINIKYLISNPNIGMIHDNDISKLCDMVNQSLYAFHILALQMKNQPIKSITDICNDICPTNYMDICPHFPTKGIFLTKIIYIYIYIYICFVY